MKLEHPIYVTWYDNGRIFVQDKHWQTSPINKITRQCTPDMDNIEMSHGIISQPDCTTDFAW